MDTRWIRTLGGPLILVPRDVLPLWTGGYGPAGEEDWDEDDTEYWRICEKVTDYAGVHTVGDRSALVLANGETPTRFVPSELLFVQRLGGLYDGDVVAEVLPVLPSVQWRHHTELEWSGTGVLFYSALHGSMVEDQQHIEIDLPTGRYTVRSTYREPDAHVSVLVALTQLVDESAAALESRDWSGAQVDDKPRTPTVVQSVRMPRDLVERVFAETERRGTTPSEVIRDLVEAGLTAIDDDVVVTVRMADLRRAIDTVVHHAA